MARPILPSLFTLLCLCGLLGFPSGFLSAQLDRAVQFHGLAQGNYLIGDSNGALNALEACLRVRPNYLPAWRLKARIHLDQSQLEAADTTLIEGLEIAPEDPELQLLQALLYGQKGEADEAMSQIQSVMQRTKANTREGRIARQLFGVLQMAEGNWDGALEAFQSIPEDESQQTLVMEALKAKAQRQAGEGDLDAAIATLDEAIRDKDPGNRTELVARHRLRRLRAQLLARFGKDGEATRALEQLRAERPDDLEVALSLTSLYANNNRWTAVERILPSLEGHSELSDILLYFQGRVALAENRVGTARAKFESAIDRQPAEGNRLFPTLLFYRGLCLHRLGRMERAEGIIIESIDSGFQAETTEEAEQIAGILMQAGRPSLAVAQLEGVLLSGGRDTAALWFQLARAHHQLGQRSLAISALTQSLEQDREQAPVLALRGAIRREMGQLEGALDDYQNAVTIEPDHTPIRYALGLTQIQHGQLSEAEASLRRTAHGSNSDPGAHLMHAMTAFAIGAHEQAEASVERFLQLAPKQPNPAALYLSCLLGRPTPALPKDPLLGYLNGENSKDEVLIWARKADNEKTARRQLCAAAYWMAQKAAARRQKEARQALLLMAVREGNPDFPEWQFANWQLKDTSANRL